MDIYIFKDNTPWGIEKHPIKGNIYKHVMSFHSIATNKFLSERKYEFILKQMIKDLSKLTNDNEPFPGIKYQKLVNDIFERDSIKKISNQPVDELTTKVIISPEQLVNFSMDELMNSDYCVMIDSINGVKKYTFSTLATLKVDKRQVHFKVEKDLFFNEELKYDPKSKNMVIRAHLDRYIKADEATIKGKKVQMFKPNGDEMNRIEPDINIIKNDTLTTDLSYNVHLEKVKLFNQGYNLRWGVIIFYNKRNNDFVNKIPLVKTNGTRRGHNIPVSILYFPITDRHIYVETTGLPIKRHICYGVGQDVQTLLDDKELIINSYITTIPPMPVSKITVETIDGRIINNPKKHLGDEDDRLIIKFDGTGLKTDDSDYFSFHPTRKDLMLLYIADIHKTLQNDRDIRWTFPFKHPYGPGAEISGIEPKVFTKQFLEIGIKFYNTETFVIDYPSLPIETNSNIPINEISVFSLNTGNFGSPSTIFWQDNNFNKNQNLFFNMYKNLAPISQIPNKQNLEAEYLRSNANQLTISKKQTDTNAILSAITTILSVGAATASGNPIAIAGAIGYGGTNVASSTTSAVFFHQNLLAKRQDLREQVPDINFGDNFIYNEIVANPADRNDNPILGLGYVKIPLPKYKDEMYDYLKQKGYYVGDLRNIYPLTNSRVLYNYVEALDIFNVIRNKMSSKSKQIISEAFTSGITFWHYRTDKLWKASGFLHYARANVETKNIV